MAVTIIPGSLKENRKEQKFLEMWGEKSYSLQPTGQYCTYQDSGVVRGVSLQGWLLYIYVAFILVYLPARWIISKFILNIILKSCSA